MKFSLKIQMDKSLGHIISIFMYMCIYIFFLAYLGLFMMHLGGDVM